MRVRTNSSSTKDEDDASSCFRCRVSKSKMASLKFISDAMWVLAMTQRVTRQTKCHKNSSSLFAAMIASAAFAPWSYYSYLLN